MSPLTPVDLPDRVDEEARNVLLLAPPLDDRSDAVCGALLGAAEPTATDLVFVTLARSPDDRIDRWRRAAGGAVPAKVGVVAATESDRATTARGSSDGVDGPIVGSVRSPGDLTGLGIELSDRLEAWADDGNRTLLCFHTLTTLLQYVDLQTAYQFLHVLTARVSDADARAHYHADPAAHDERALNTLRTLFDAVVEREGDGWVVETR